MQDLFLSKKLANIATEDNSIMAPTVSGSGIMSLPSTVKSLVPTFPASSITVTVSVPFQIWGTVICPVIAPEPSVGKIGKVELIELK